MPLSKRIIPCLDVDKGRVVKGVHFTGIDDAGDPVELARRYCDEGADELVFLDITASTEGRNILRDMVRRVARTLNIPFTVGGGIRTLDDARLILCSGADKISVNTAAVTKPSLISTLAERFGQQCVVVAIDVKRQGVRSDYSRVSARSKQRSGYEVFTYGGRKPAGLDAVWWAKRVEELGAGEILLTSIDADGTKDGYDLELTRIVSKNSGLPVIASGGCGSSADIVDVFRKGMADAALAASIFHYREHTIQEVKEFLRDQGIEVSIR